MKLAGLIPFFCTALLSIGLGACQSEEGYECEVTFCDVECDQQGAAELGMELYTYPDAETSDEALAMCQMDQAADRPADANAYSCFCQSL